MNDFPRARPERIWLVRNENLRILAIDPEKHPPGQPITVVTRTAFPVYPGGRYGTSGVQCLYDVMAEKRQIALDGTPTWVPLTDARPVVAALTAYILAEHWVCRAEPKPAPTRCPCEQGGWGVTNHLPDCRIAYPQGEGTETTNE